VLAPEEQIGRNIFACVKRQSIEQKIRQRIDRVSASQRAARYSGEKDSLSDISFIDPPRVNVAH
jgi:hypothetical protein